MKRFHEYSMEDLIDAFICLLVHDLPIPVDLEAALIEYGVDTSSLRPIRYQ